MNTPPKVKRFTLTTELRGDAPADGSYAQGIVDRQIGAKFAKIVTTFEHLENDMTCVLAVLLGDFHHGTAGYVMRAIAGARTKIDLMRGLLQKSPINQETPQLFDEILSEYQAISRVRNRWVHGKWFTKFDPSAAYESGRAVYICEQEEHGAFWLESREIKEAELDAFFIRIMNLFDRIENEVSPILRERRMIAERLSPN